MARRRRIAQEEESSGLEVTDPTSAETARLLLRVPGLADAEATKIGERFERAGVDPVHGEPMHVYAIVRPTSSPQAAR